MKYANEPTKKQIEDGCESITKVDSGVGAKVGIEGLGGYDDEITGDQDQDGK